jgi:hypothetical protein
MAFSMDRGTPSLAAASLSGKNLPDMREDTPRRI